MAENPRPPVAIRIVRPYETEDALLEHELETLGKTSVLLIGAHPRPTGVILRFELTLASGATVLRGEGRVLGHKEDAFRGQAGLTLRFTRLDPRSKSVVDRATAMREARSHAGGGPPSRALPLADVAIAEALTAATPGPSAAISRSAKAEAEAEAQAEAEAIAKAKATADAIAEQAAAVANARAAAREKANATARANSKRTSRSPSLTPPPAPVEVSEPPPAPVPVSAEPSPAPVPVSAEPSPAPVQRRVTRTEPRFPAPPPQPPAGAPSPSQASPPNAPQSPRVLEPPADRAALLDKLRARAGGLSPERVGEILARR